MLSSINSFILIIIMCALISFGTGCSAVSSQSSKETQAQKTENKQEDANKKFPAPFKSDDPNTLPPADKSFNAGNAFTIQDESSMLAGVWRMSYQGPACMAQAEMVFQPNGGYSGFTQCADGSYAFHTVGTWRVLQSGAVRVQYTNYSPKEYMGNPIRIPDGETMYYRFLDRNRLGFSGGIIAYRVN